MAIYCPKCAKRKWPWQAGAYGKYLFQCTESSIFTHVTIERPEWIGTGGAYKAALEAAYDELRAMHAKCIQSDRAALKARLSEIYGRKPTKEAETALAYIAANPMLTYDQIHLIACNALGIEREVVE